MKFVRGGKRNNKPRIEIQLENGKTKLLSPKEILVDYLSALLAKYVVWKKRAIEVLLITVPGIFMFMFVFMWS